MVIAQTLLAVGLILVCCGVGGWDIYCLYRESPEYTVSNLLGLWSSNFPVLPFVLGMLAGHLFWPRSQVPLNIPKG